MQLELGLNAGYENTQTVKINSTGYANLLIYISNQKKEIGVIAYRLNIIKDSIRQLTITVFMTYVLIAYTSNLPHSELKVRNA